MKRKVITWILVGIMLALVAAVTVMTVVEVVNGTAETNTIIRLILLLAASLLTIVRIITGGRGRAVTLRSQYEEAYKDELRDAFSGDDCKKEKDTLIKGIALYNDEKYMKAIETLSKLLPECRTDSDHAAVLMFIALSYTDLGAAEDALAAYHDLLKYDNNRSSVWSNMGLLYMNLGRHEDAIGYLRNAVKRDENNAYAYNNLASAYLRVQDYENAAAYAELALAKKSNLYQAASAAALAYRAMGDEANSRKYYNMYVMNGGNGEALRSMLDSVVTPDQSTDTAK